MIYPLSGAMSAWWCEGYDHAQQVQHRVQADLERAGIREVVKVILDTGEVAFWVNEDGEVI